MLKSQQLKQEMQEKWEEIKALKDKVVEDGREYTEEEKALIDETLDAVGEIEDQIRVEEKQEALNDRIDRANELFAQEPQQQKQRRPVAQKARVDAMMTYGRQFVDSEEWKWFLDGHSSNGRFVGKGFTSPPVGIKGLLERKEVITGVSDTSAGAWIIPDQSGIYEPIGRYPLNLRQLVDVRQTNSDTVEYVTQITQVTQATPVAEANVTEYTGATGEISGEKPEGTTNWEREQAVVKTIAVWIPATTRALADAAQLRTLIDSELRDDVNEELESQLLNGNGVGENFTGLSNTAGILTQAFVTDIAQTARRAITNLLVNGRQMPTAWLLHPEDWQAFDLLQDANNQYYWGGPTRMGLPTLWGVPVAQSFFLTQGTGYLGNWRKMVLWDRQQATIAASDSHEDFFIRNMVAIRCELRAAMAVIRPTGFVETDFSGGS